MIGRRWDGSIVCPVCWQPVDVFDGLIGKHSTGRTTPEERLSIRCMVEKITETEAEALADRLVRAAHP